MKKKKKENNFGQISRKCWEYFILLGPLLLLRGALGIKRGSPSNYWGKFITRLFFFIPNPGIKDGKDTGVFRLSDIILTPGSYF